MIRPGSNKNVNIILITITRPRTKCWNRFAKSVTDLDHSTQIFWGLKNSFLSSYLMKSEIRYFFSEPFDWCAFQSFLMFNLLFSNCLLQIMRCVTFSGQIIFISYLKRCAGVKVLHYDQIVFIGLGSNHFYPCQWPTNSLSKCLSMVSTHDHQGDLKAGGVCINSNVFCLSTILYSPMSL